jgi:hypothetical protein
MARRSGLSQPHLANLMNRDHMGLGLDAAAALGRAWGMTVAEMLQAARGEEPPVAAALPNLETALTIARPPFSAQAVAIARRIGSTSRDFSVALWTILLGEVEADLADATSDGAMSLSDGSVTSSSPGRSHTRP